ncbi:helix-turn-helix transcriptional regulator [Iamia majanohamensis]|uniref:Helix-turn-helix transcriptional regulator n=1 Tax=Iamia majanohamensis TaxID=467976 RepID=A0AAE9YCM1_9ACTN|nr:helix-turn-helix transcriptional regulator [Iamia majanohamensis]WCO66377.1 helix-turn-helix transcriptional regulator [Iamia majanohamensis]
MTSSPDSAFSTRLRGELAASGLSQAELARRVGVSQQTVSKWLAAETQPRIKVVPLLAEALDLSPTELSATLVSANGAGAFVASTDDARVAALVHRIRSLAPAQLARVEAYVHGLRDAAP